MMTTERHVDGVSGTEATVAVCKVLRLINKSEPI
jgi:hypothetical protein